MLIVLDLWTTISSRLSCNLVCRPSTFPLRVYIHIIYIYMYTQYAYASLDRRNNGIVRARENCNSVVVAVHACATAVPRNRCATPTRIENPPEEVAKIASRPKRPLSNLQFTRSGNNRRKSIRFRSRADISADSLRDSRRLIPCLNDQMDEN